VYNCVTSKHTPDAYSVSDTLELFTVYTKEEDPLTSSYLPGRGGEGGGALGIQIFIIEEY
jgi:hypothetical protein